jgi:hypothetical protein
MSEISRSSVVYAGIRLRLQNSNQRFNNAGRRVEFSATDAFFLRKLCNAVFVCAPEQILAGPRIGHINIIREDVNYIAEDLLIQIVGIQ